MQKPSGNKKVLCFGEVLWDVLPTDKKIGGAPLNVAYHLHQLSVDVTLSSRIGNDDLGLGIQHFISGAGLHSCLQIDTVQPTGVALAEVTGDHEVTYNLIDPSAWDFIEYNAQLARLAEDASYLVYGSLVTRNPTSRNTLRKLLAFPLTKVLDVNLRSPYYSKDRLEDLLGQSQIIKMNMSELDLLSDWFNYPGGVEDKIKFLRKDFGAQILLVTDGAKGAYLLQEEEIYYEPGIPIAVADTIGSGDAFLAGFLFSLMQNYSPPEALKNANQLGALVAGKSGGCPAYHIDNLFLKH